MKSKPSLSSLSIEDSSSSSPMDEVIQSYIQAINSFEEREASNLTDDLEQFLLHVAKTGNILASWGKVKKVLVKKMKDVFEEFYKDYPYKSGQVHTNYENDDFEDMKERLLNLADEFENPPFTVQRLCELITNPRKNYTKCEKFMRAVEKNLLVVSSWNYSSRRNSETTDQVNGGFDSRTSYNSVDRPWAALPHSPTTTSAPVVPFIPKDDDPSKPNELNNTETDKATTDAEDSVKPESISSAPEDKDNSSSKDERGDEASQEAGQQSDETPNDKKEAADFEESSEPKTEEVAANEAVASESTEESSSRDNTSVTAATFTSVSDVHEGMLTCTKKDTNDDPLPGVGTLVEKHSVIKCAVTDTLAETGDVAGNADAFGFVSTQAETSPITVEMDASPASSTQSSKRKHSDSDDSVMDVEGSSKRPKQDEAEEAPESSSSTENEDEKRV